MRTYKCNLFVFYFSVNHIAVHRLLCPADGETEPQMAFISRRRRRAAASQHQHQTSPSSDLCSPPLHPLRNIGLFSSKPSASGRPSSPWTTPAKRRRPCSWWLKPTRRSKRPDPSSGGCSGKKALILCLPLSRFGMGERSLHAGPIKAC